MHKIPAIAQTAEKPSRESVLEDKVLALLGHKGEMTANQLRRFIRGTSTKEVSDVCRALRDSGEVRLIVGKSGATYGLRYQGAQ